MAACYADVPFEVIYYKVHLYFQSAVVKKKGILFGKTAKPPKITSLVSLRVRQVNEASFFLANILS
jgi:hypothetical protein